MKILKKYLITLLFSLLINSFFSCNTNDLQNKNISLNSDSCFLVPIENGNSFVYINFNDGTFPIKNKFKSASFFDNKGYAIVKNDNDKFGLINKNGDEVIPLVYDSIMQSDPRNMGYFFQVLQRDRNNKYKEGLFDVINKKNILPINYDWIWSMENFLVGVDAKGDHYSSIYNIDLFTKGGKKIYATKVNSAPIELYNNALNKKDILIYIQGINEKKIIDTFGNIIADVTNYIKSASDIFILSKNEKKITLGYQRLLGSGNNLYYKYDYFIIENKKIVPLLDYFNSNIDSILPKNSLSKKSDYKYESKSNENKQNIQINKSNKSRKSNWVNCSNCHGKGLNICIKCNGIGDIQCSDCYGKGLKWRSNTQVFCTACGGKGKLKCFNCNGIGNTGNCFTCQGRGQVEIFSDN